jgi:tetratricopeptide (TPR) repeat protein
MVLSAAALLVACAAQTVETKPATRTPQELLEQARSAREAGDLVQARTSFEAAAAADPSWDLPRLDLAELLVGDGVELDGVVALLEQAQAIRADNPRLYQIRGNLLELQREDSGAAESYERALALRDDPDLRCRRARVLARLRREGEAIAELEQVRKARPQNWSARVDLAELYESAGKLKPAEAELQSASDAVPEQTGPLAALARFYDRHGKKKQAAKVKQRLREIERPERRLRPLGPS